MELIKDLQRLTVPGKTAVTLGKFDGLHRGHQTLIQQIMKKKTDGFLTCIFTFDRPPKRLLDGINDGLILTNKERREKLNLMGTDILVQCPFTREIAAIEPEEFVEQILMKQLKAEYIAVRTDFHFGHNRRGDVRLLEQLSRRYGFELCVRYKERYQNKIISSSYIREELKKGNMELVSNLLGYHYFVTGEIVRGKQLGRRMGVPTANQYPEEGKLLPPNGVYASRIMVDGKVYNGMSNIGIRPTVENTVLRNVETYLFDFHEDIYGHQAKIEFLAYERPEKKFATLEELKQQLYQDMNITKVYFEQKHMQPYWEEK